MPPPAAMVNGAHEAAAIVATDRDVGSQARDTKVGYAYLVLDETNGRFGIDLAIKKRV